MITRQITPILQLSAQKYPIVGIVGPRQSGKTTLAKAAFPDFEYVNLEAPDTRQFAQEDPRGFLASYPNKVILDEIQRVPDLFSYLQVHTDAVGKPGQYLITGSQHFLMMENMSQSLSGRIALHTLLPLSYSELLSAQKVDRADIFDLLYSGSYPRIYDAMIEPAQWYADYVQTYLERDLRLLSNVVNLVAFERFVRLCAGRTGQILNLSSLATDAGVTHNTAKAWVSILEASFIIFLVQPHYENFNKRLIKSPKLYFTDTGLASWLLGLENSGQMRHHYMVGALFETWVIAEYWKYRLNLGRRPNAFFWKDQSGREIDLLIDQGAKRFPIEIKSGATVNPDFFSNLARYQKLAGISTGGIVYGGTEHQIRSNYHVCPWFAAQTLFAEANQAATSS